MTSSFRTSGTSRYGFSRSRTTATRRAVRSLATSADRSSRRAAVRAGFLGLVGIRERYGEPGQVQRELAGAGCVIPAQDPRRRHPPHHHQDLAHSAYRTSVIEHSATLGINLEVVSKDPATRGFTPLPRRWTVERTFGRLMLHRHLVRDYEALPARSEAVIHLAMIDLMARRLTGESTSTWRGTRNHIRRNRQDQTPSQGAGSERLERGPALVAFALVNGAAGRAAALDTENLCSRQ
ncbi:hypothetical protein [Microbispora sp. CA-102843]|uniref:hypothetical protein n=1 Tax=Microbispora sp. CA-102843 TaxID=3239952 RepID=UPI003D8DD0E8